MPGSRCVLGMYRRMVITVWGARGVSAGAAVPGSRYADQALRWFCTGNTLRCDKDKADHTKQEEVLQDKVNEPPAKETLLNVIGGMKVEISSKKRFQALKMSKARENNAEQVENMESTSSMFQRAGEEIHTESKPLSPELMAAASAVASSLPFDKRKVESELLQQLRKHEQETEVQRKGDGNISNLISDMKVGKHAGGSRTASWRSNQIQFDEDGRGYTHDRGVTQELAGVKSRRGLYAGKRLNIFPVFANSQQPTGTEVCPNLWDLELAKQIAATSELPPRNAFDEMLQWTKEGKLWTFPIDNEAGLEEEQKVEFHEHIFLDKYLEDFPKHGPIRHFMELVVCGLSKNPYISVKKKQEHIEWFRDYFHEKEDILKESEIYLN